MKLEALDALGDDELRNLIARAEGILKQRDEDRKAKAMADATATLAAVGLSLKDLAHGKKAKSGNAGTYHGGHRYQHPTDKTKVWTGTGKKPNWLREIEAQGGKPIEL